MTKNMKRIVIFAAHLLVLGILLYPTVMELIYGSSQAMTPEEVTVKMGEHPHFNDGNFLNGDIMAGRVRYIIYFGPFQIRSIIA